MTIDEAIKHAEEVAYNLEQEAECIRSWGKENDTKQGAINCEKCAGEHRQLAEWLKELKLLRKQIRWTSVSKKLPDDSGEYFVSVTDKEDEDYKQVRVAWFAHPKDYDIQDGEWRELMIDEIVEAWMPLPESYKGE